MNTPFPAKSSPVPPVRQQHRPWRRALGWLLLLGPFFFLSYGLANWWTGQLGHVGSYVFGWEHRIPFWAWTIVPYMSLDAFYAGSLLLCATRAELDAHAKRLLSASVLSVLGFLLFPLQFSFARPTVDGFNGWLFEVLAGFDKPYNQAPSLHVSLALLVGLVYWHHSRGLLRGLLAAWFGLIVVSVFTTYQHHFIDGVAGAVVGVVCLYLFPDAPQAWRPVRAPADRPWRRKLAAGYGLGAALLLAAATLLGGGGWGLLWPAGALLLVGLAYAGLGASVFQKHDGRQRVAAQLLLAPYCLGAWISSRLLTRRQAPAAEVLPGLWLGRAPGRPDWPEPTYGAVLDLTAEFNLSSAARARPHQSVPLLDLVLPSQQELQRAVAALHELWPHRPVLVHCALGYSRSALVVAAWLLATGRAATPAEAVTHLRTARPQVHLTERHLAVLAAYQAISAVEPPPALS
ncbi:phosphatase PAP2/dual specificity phosphatase family protein [Hymenobacter psychrophilus]|uniref:Protein-tyrosine phosphatase n=1 Tax=Hymenobacter psychrophilus TaxID=651662 RepID=A0A1H3JI35_9BACT|nr:phosphatase PAP2/dual specificity phosphatase family protein [Hymenobacter psychrophilus]SDY38894.1 Protein-tyrosine phosphatase [Hymenobacter psychrophilus]